MSTEVHAALARRLSDHEPKICLQCERPDPRLNISVLEVADVIANTLKEYDQITFHNCWEYFVYLLELKVKEEYGVIDGNVEKIKAILNDFAAKHGKDATVSFLLCLLRQHRSIVHKVKKEVLLALGYDDNIPQTP